MSFNVPWVRPYPDLAKLPPSDIRRLTVEVPKTDSDTIISVTLNPAVLTSICQYAIKHTAAAISAHGLAYADAPEFYEYLRQRSYSEFVKETLAQDVRGGTPGVLKRGADVGDKPAGTGKEAKAGRTGKGGTGTKSVKG
tara:strand:- start:243 stop:659 length:417 start_codon:yes stop_codon:yes gene_type:complete